MQQKTIVSDIQIRVAVRNVLSRHWIDLRFLSIGCARGVVRLQGELRHHGRLSDNAVRAEELELLEADLRRVRGVRLVHLSFDNWRRGEGEQWARVLQRAATRLAGQAEREPEELEPGSSAQPAPDTPPRPSLSS